MLRLLFVTGSLAHGGAERQSVALMNRLSERGHDCHALYVKREADLRNTVRVGEGNTMRSLCADGYLDPRALTRFAAHIERLKPSAIIAANAYALAYASVALRLARRHATLVVTYHSTRLLQVKEQLQMLVYRPFFWSADCAVFVCQTQRRRWRHRGVFARRNEVIYNGIDLDAFSPRLSEKERYELRGQLGFTDDDYVIGLSGVLRPEKNHAQLIDAVALLRRRGIPARALLIGDGPLRHAVLARARRADIGDHVAITGFQQDVRPYVEACDTLTLCSFTEALSMAVIEAMALKKPVVHSNVGGAAEIIVPGDNGFLFPVGDTEAFAEQLRILADRDTAHTMGENARTLVESRFSETTMVDRYEHLLEELAQPHLARGGARRAMIHADHGSANRHAQPQSAERLQ